MAPKKIPIESRPIYERADWTRDRDKLDRRVRRWRLKEWYDGKAEHFALSKPRIEPPGTREDDFWECTDMLGRGSFGMVGKWTKFDNRGSAIDTVAIKQADFDRELDIDRHGSISIPWEARTMLELYEQGCDNVTRLRGLKLFESDHSTANKWRYYIQYYRYGTLHGLISNYKEGNRRHPGREERIPEAFIWQAFHDFAKTAHHMRTVHFDERVAPPGRDHYVLHLDLKHENVLLGDAPADKSFMTYPAIKVGDWGMAACTNLQDPDNSRIWRGRGTIVWFPPEQRNFGRYGSNWRYPILGPSNAPFGMSHVIWQIGANIYGLMNLNQHNEELDEQVNRHEKMEAELRRGGYSMFEELRSRVYSSELAALVEDCLRLDPQRRPGVRELVRRTEHGLKPYLERWMRTGQCPSLKVKIV